MKPESMRGIFVSEDELPPKVWRMFMQIAETSGTTPQNLLKRLILRECYNFQVRNRPLLERIMEAGVREAKKYLGP